MFVQSNKVKDLKAYFSKKLELHFSPSEVKFMFSEALQKRLGLGKEELLFPDEIRLSESDLLFVRTIAHRLLDNEPFQYIIGESEFCGLPISCDPRALIPRPETEELVSWIREEFRDKTQKLQFVDYCSGSGCIALALKNYFPLAEVTGFDLSEGAVALSRENAQRNALEVTFELADVLNFPPQAISTATLDCIVSNPPYIPEKDKSGMHANVLEFEPHLALFVSNDDPLIFYRKIAELAQNQLKPGGKLFFEIHEDLSSEAESLLNTFNFTGVEIKEDLQGKKRMVKAVKA
ncbi:MAG: SAM-dependent methyltransferase [Crocinitomicaceae bacterium]|jgi:release factor glutamine methyltransferase|nr:SAM-dependent methyltransferase [Crocinitomicaceae bacterium]